MVSSYSDFRTLDPSKYLDNVSPGRTATIVVAAVDSSLQSKAQADYVCDSVADNVEIQAALDALPAAGGEVKLLEGTYNCEATINLDSNQTLRGCGKNTILTTTTADLIFLSAVGASGTEKTGIVIANLQIDGGAGLISDCGIYFNYVDYSFIQNVYPRRHYSGAWRAGIVLEHSDFNQIVNNTCQGNRYDGIYLKTSNNNTISGNTCQGNGFDGIYLDTSSNNTISGNTCQGNSYYGIILFTSSNNTISGNTCQGNSYYGIILSTSSNNTISGNTCQGNGRHGIQLITSANNNTVIGNTCVANSQTTTNAYDDIYVSDSDYNNIQGNTCRTGALANKPRYGINISNAACDGNLVTNNDLYNDGFGTGSFNDAGTLTIVRDDNRGIEITQVRHYDYVKNTSGGDLAAGDVVVLKAVAAGNEITTTTTAGDQKVFGMVAEAIANNASGYVLVKGKTTVLKVDGTTDIAIGDLIGCFTTAKIGMKAAAGKMAFAIALEAYAIDDSNGVIDALLITPRQAI